MLIRPRLAADMPACALLVRDVHTADGYPRYLPSDLAAFLAAPGAYQAWVAVDGDCVVGHVALHRSGAPSALALAGEVAGLPADRLAVVARLLVSARARRLGAGRQLLGAAQAAARERGLRPVLDVDVELDSAIAMYERLGWVRAGRVTVRFSEDRAFDEYVYLGPS